MSVKYKVREFKNPRSDWNGCFYGKASIMGEWDINYIAALVQEKCTVNEADCIAVIKALVSVMRLGLQDSMKIRLNGFGSFKIALKTHMSLKANEFTASNVYGFKVLFMPEYTIDKSGNRINVLTQGAKAEQQEVYVTGVSTKDLQNNEDE